MIQTRPLNDTRRRFTRQASLGIRSRDYRSPPGRYFKNPTASTQLGRLQVWPQVASDLGEFVR
jgi:hypothetical protein